MPQIFFQERNVIFWRFWLENWKGWSDNFETIHKEKSGVLEKKTYKKNILSWEPFTNTQVLRCLKMICNVFSSSSTQEALQCLNENVYCNKIWSWKKSLLGSFSNTQAPHVWCNWSVIRKYKSKVNTLHFYTNGSKISRTLPLALASPLPLGSTPPSLTFFFPRL